MLKKYTQSPKKSVRSQIIQNDREMHFCIFGLVDMSRGRKLVEMGSIEYQRSQIQEQITGITWAQVY